MNKNYKYIINPKTNRKLLVKNKTGTNEVQAKKPSPHGCCDIPINIADIKKYFLLMRRIKIFLKYD